MHSFWKICGKIITVAISTSFMFIPERLFEKYKFFPKVSDEMNIIVNRVLFLFCIIVLSTIISAFYIWLRKKITIKGKNYTIQVEYGDILNIKNCKKVINFDECYNTKVGDLPSDIKSTSICGQYLLKNPDIDIEKLIDNVNLKQARTNSKFKNKTRYQSGKVVPNGDELLMAFAKLDENGVGKFFTFKEYIDCLSILWEEIDKYYGQKDVCVPILGSGLTRINDHQLTQQELLDIMIMSYKLNTHKIKNPYKLRIICRKKDDFSLNKIGESL